MKKIILPLIIGLCLQAYAQPTNNPILDTYPASDAFVLKGMDYGDYSWTGDIQWATVYDVTTDLTSAPFSGLSNVTKDDLPPNHPNADHDDFASAGGLAADDLATVNAAIVQLSAAGGGVLYFPAGVYIFSDHIKLQDGVVLRGADPTGVTDARTSGYNPPTDFFFPRLPGIIQDNDVPFYKQRLSPTAVAASTAIGGAYTAPGSVPSKININKKIEIDQTFPNGLTATNYGIVNVDIMRAAIQFLQENRADNTIDRFSVTFGSDHKNRMEGGNVVVWGCRLNNVTELEWLVIQDADFNSWQAWPSRTSPNIDVMVKKNTIIGNNRINDMDYDFRANGDPVSTNPADLLLVDSFGMAIEGVDNSVAFGDPDTDYTNNDNLYLSNAGVQLSGGAAGLINSNNKYATYRLSTGNGIAANRSSRVGYGGSGPHNPAGEPSLQRRGVSVRNNWVFAQIRSGFHVSGFGVEVRDNVRTDISGDVLWVDITGQGQGATPGQTTLENRGIDASGDNVLLDNNNITVNTRSIRGGAPGNDGEGILIQQNDGQKPVRNWTITNNTVSGNNAYIGLFKLESMRGVSIANNTVASQGILVNCNPNFFPGIARNITINNNTTATGISMLAGLLDQTATAVITNNTAPSITLPDYDNSALTPSTLFNDLFFRTWGNSVTPSFSDQFSGIANNSGDWQLQNRINREVYISIVTPADGQVLNAGVGITVQVDVDENPASTFPVETVTLYDASQLAANQQIQNFGHRTDANAQAGATVLTLNPTTGYYEGAWTPSAAHLDYGLLTVEAVCTQQSVQNGVSSPTYAPRNFRDNSFAMLGFVDGETVTFGNNPIEIVSSGTTPELSFDMVPGGTYMLQKTTDLAGGSWQFVTGQIITNGSTKTTGTLSDSGAVSSDDSAFYRVVLR